jgi:integrase
LVTSWTFRYSSNGRERYAGLGPLHAVSLKDAREKAANFRRLRHAEVPIDPLEERHARRLAGKLAAAKTMTFEACAQAFVTAMGVKWRSDKHRHQWWSSLEADVFPTLGSLPVQSIDVGLVMLVLQRIWLVKPETASRVRGRIESVLDWARARGYRSGENPARWKGHLDNLLPLRSKVAPVKHHAALAYDELPSFMAALRHQDGVAAMAVEFLILTVSRTGEVIGARWSEINLAKREWIIPGARMKAGKEHRVPLSDRAMEIVQTLSAVNEGAFVFPGARGGRGLSATAMSALLMRMGRAEITVHGFRSTFSDWVSERTNFASQVREAALAHAVADKVEAAYRRGDLFDKRRQLAAAWERYCGAPPERMAAVVALRSAGG